MVGYLTMSGENPWLEWRYGDDLGLELPDHDGYLYTRLRAGVGLFADSNACMSAEITAVAWVRYKPEAFANNCVQFEVLPGQGLLSEVQLYGLLPPPPKDTTDYDLVRFIRDHVEEWYGIGESAGDFSA